MFIHPSALIDSGAKIGHGTKIWHFSHVMGGAIIGNDCILGQNVFIADGVIVGDGVKIQNNVSLFRGVILEDGVFVGPSCVFTNVLNPRSFIERKDEFKTTIVRKGASLGANATIVCGIEIGEYALIGAATVITKNVVPFSLMIGNPSRHAGWVSKHGAKLHFDENGKANCMYTGESYIKESPNSIRPE